MNGGSDEGLFRNINVLCFLSLSISEVRLMVRKGRRSEGD